MIMSSMSSYKKPRNECCANWWGPRLYAMRRRCRDQGRGGGGVVESRGTPVLAMQFRKGAVGCGIEGSVLARLDGGCRDRMKRC
jgi:hypothetical protein